MAKRERSEQVARGPMPLNIGKDEIERIGEKVAAAIGYKPQCDLSGLLVQYGGKVSIKDFWKLDGTSDESIVVNPTSDFEIFIPPHTTPERDRFTIAHELGHYFLHYLMVPENKHSKTPFSASRYGNKRVEWEANWFAAGFLMPQRAFKKAFEFNDGRIGRIADQFGVSTAAAYVRAKALGLHADAAK